LESRRLPTMSHSTRAGGSPRRVSRRTRFALRVLSRTWSATTVLPRSLHAGCGRLKSSSYGADPGDMPDLGTIGAPECLHDQHRLAMAQLRDLFGPVSYIVD